MRMRWVALVLAALLCTTACKRTENTPDVEEEDLELDFDSGVEADPSEINTDRGDTNVTQTQESPANPSDSTETITETTEAAPAP